MSLPFINFADNFFRLTESTTELPLISIAVATYNAGQYLREQLDTLIGQTYPNLEVVVSDDGSTDGTLEVLEEYSKRYSNFFVHHNPPPHGVKPNFANAIHHSKGMYIALSDQDDIWMLDKIEKLYNVIGDKTMAYHNSLFVDSNGKSLDRSIASRLNCYYGDDPRAFLMCNCVSGHALMFHRKLIDIALPFPHVEHHDWWLAFRAADHGGIVYLDEVLVHYRQHSNSQTDFFSLKRKTAQERKAEKEKLDRDQADWLAACASVPGEQQGFIKGWIRILQNEKKRTFNFDYFKMALKARKSLFFMRKKGGMSTFFYILRTSWSDDARRIQKNLKNRILFRRRREDDDLLFMEDQ